MVGDGMLGSPNEISREIRQIQTRESPSIELAARNTARLKVPGPPARGRVGPGAKHRPPVSLVDMAGGSQSPHSSVDRREPNPPRAKGGRKVDSGSSNA